MVKKVKKKDRRGHKDKRDANASPKAVSQESFTTETETPDEGVIVVKDKRVCPHLDKGVDLEKVSAKLKSAEPLRCEDCREGVVDKRSGKGKGKQGKKKGGVEPKSVSKAIWVCVECGHFSCGGAGFPTTPKSHAVRHAKQHRHSLAIQFANPQLRWCFPCNTIIPVKKPEEDGEQKDALHDILKLIKGRSSLGPAKDVEDIWFGSGSVTSGIKSETCTSIGSDVSGGYRVRGLANLGNTCFFNSIMQNLLALDKLRDYFLKLDGSLGPLAASLKELVIETNPEAGLRGVINPRSFFGCVCAKAPQFKGYQQHDSHELLRCLLDALCTEESSARKQMKSSQEAQKSSQTDCTFVDAIFGGQLSSAVSCLACGHSSTVYEPFLDLSLPVPTKKPPSRKAKPVSRAKKQKPPPKKSGRSRPKVSNSANVLPAQRALDESTGGSSSCHIRSSEPVPDQTATVSGDSLSSGVSKATMMTKEKDLVSENLFTAHNADSKQGDEEVSETLIQTNDSAWLDYLEPDALSNDKDLASEIDNISVVNGSGNENVVPSDTLTQSTLELSIEVTPTRIDAAPCSDNLTWFDFCGSGKLSDCENMASRLNDESISQDSITKDAAQRNVNVEPSSESSEQVSFNGSNVKDELLMPAQDSAIILLPYKEDTSTSDILRGEGELSSSAVGVDQDSSEFDCFGGLFDEPEAAVLSVKSSEANAASHAGITAGHCSESEPDEVDNSDAPVSVESCLSFFVKPELLSKDEHAWQCENCSKVLRERKMRLRKKSLKAGSDIVIIAGEDRNLSVLFSSGENQPSLTGSKNLNNRMLEKDVLDSQLPQVNNENNGMIETSKKAEIKPVASQPEDGQHERGDSAYNPPESLSSDKPCPQESHSSGNNEPDSVGCESDAVHLGRSNSFTASCQSEGSEDEEMDSKNVKVKRDATKRILINRAPPILTIHFKRFSQDTRGRLSKLNGHIDFRETINLKSHMDPRCQERDQYKYHLLGVVEHSGTMRGGHYVAYVRGGTKSTKRPENGNGDSTWYHASDAYVREVTLEEVLRCEAYILFYERI